MSHYVVPPANRKNARRMRKALTDAELKLWNATRAHRLMGLSFRRQMPISGYVVDFACPSKKLIVEVDGSQHGTDVGAKADVVRDRCLAALGWTVLRFWNDDVCAILTVFVSTLSRPPVSGHLSIHSMLC